LRSAIGNANPPSGKLIDDDDEFPHAIFLL
jgi:hypothetical protein